jgi:hypothetical protein
MHHNRAYLQKLEVAIDQQPFNSARWHEYAEDFDF